MKDFMKINGSLARERNRRNFLLRCRFLKVIPNFIKFKQPAPYNNYFLHQKYLSILHKFYFQTLNLEIQDCCNTIKHLERNYEKLVTFLTMSLQPDTLYDFLSKQRQFYNKAYYLAKKVHIKKIDKLVSLENKKFKCNDNWITNLTNLNIPENIKYILSLGPKFSIPSKHYKIENIIANLEVGIKDMPFEIQNNIRGKVTNVLQNFKNNKEDNFSTFDKIFIHNLKETKTFFFK